MADRKISEFAATAVMADADILTTVSGGVNKKITWANLQTEIIDDIAMQPLSATAWVVASDANAYTLAYATKLQTAGAKVWICDGTDDQVQIQAAIDYCDSLGGGKVLLSEGTFTIAATIDLESNITLWGSGVNVTIITLANSSDCHMIEGDTETMIDIGYMTLDGNGDNQASGRGIYFATVTWSRIHDLYIYDTEDAGIKFYGSSDYSIIDKCWILNSKSDRCIHINDSDHVDITNNYCYGGEGSEGDSIDIDAAHHCNVIGNEVADAERCGIFIEQGAYDIVCSGNDIHDCNDDNNAGHGIMVNTYNRTSYGLSATRYITIVGNTIYNNAGHGITVTPAYGDPEFDECEYITITGNTIMNNDQGAGGRDGISLSGGGTIKYVSVTGNICSDDQGGATQTYGIDIGGTADRTVVVGNICMGNATGGINDGGTNTEAGHNITA